MAQEIAEQPTALAATIAALQPLRAEIAELARGRRRLCFFARGSSDNAAIYGRYLAEIHAGWPATLAAPSIATLYAAKIDLADTVAVAISQSGETAEIVESLQWAKARGAVGLAITNSADSSLAAAADLVLPTAAGVELAVPATKTFTTQVAATAVLVAALAPVPDALDWAFEQVPTAAEQMLATSATTLEEMANILASKEEVLTSGRGLCFGTTLEIALKLEETCLRPVRGLSYADLLHGPIAVVDAHHATLLVAAPNGPTLPGMYELARRLRARGSVVLGIGGDPQFHSEVDLGLPGPDLPEELAPLVLPIPGQLLVERLARTLGLNPDAPRGLNKITQTD